MTLAVDLECKATKQTNKNKIPYQLPLILTALLHVDLINVAYFTACVSVSGIHDIAFYE